MKNIEWADVTWNPVTGCPHGCTWTAPDGKVVGCYAKSISDRFHFQPDFSKPVFHADRLYQPDRWRKPRRIFVCSMGDLFADCVPELWIRNVLRVIERNPQHTFLLLTKNPSRLCHFSFPANAQVGVTLDTNNRSFAYYQASVRWESYEPLTCDMHPFTPAGHLERCGVDWVVIGALSAGARKYQPEREWVINILRACGRWADGKVLPREAGLPVFMKDNLDCEALGIPRLKEII